MSMLSLGPLIYRAPSGSRPARGRRSLQGLGPEQLVTGCRLVQSSQERLSALMVPKRRMYRICLEYRESVQTMQIRTRPFLGAQVPLCNSSVCGPLWSGTHCSAPAAQDCAKILLLQAGEKRTRAFSTFQVALLLDASRLRQGSKRSPKGPVGVPLCMEVKGSTTQQPYMMWFLGPNAVMMAS